jgi:hypothetical protein
MSAVMCGSDPEVMLLDKAGRLVSAIPVIPGDKDNPSPLRNGSMQHDNVNVEFGIIPTDNEDVWVERTGDVIRQIADFVRPSGLRLFCQASANFPDEALQDELARKFGCEPDFNPYDVGVNSINPDAAKSNFRTAGGHIHIGAEDVAGDFQATLEMAKAMDVFVGIPSLLLDRDPTSQARRNLYGKAGCHRPKSYGVEYRSAGNFWCARPELTRLMFKLTQDAVSAWRSRLLTDINEGAIRSTIDTGDAVMARVLMNDLTIPLLSADTEALLRICLNLPLTDINEGWSL